MSESSGISSSVFMCGGRQTVVSLRSGLCSYVSRVGGSERMVTRRVVSSYVGVGVAIELGDG